jgi:hypothetical protein
MILSWLWVPEWTDMKLAVLAFRVLHRQMPSYIRSFGQKADLPVRIRLSSSSQL